MDLNRFLIGAAMIMAMTFSSCSKHKDELGNTPLVTPDTNEPVFAKGADISWVTEMEKDEVRFYNSDGNETECTALMKELGFDAIRLRVWVDPEEGWCGKEDVLAKAGGRTLSECA